MKKLLSIALLVVFAGLTVSAQTDTKTTKKTKANVTGFVKDSEEGDALVRATIQIMTEDTTKMVAGGVTNTLGGYTIKNVEEGTYIVKISYLGYHNFTRKITVRNGETIHNVGTTLLIPNTILIEGAVVTAALPQMEVREDTIIFNADAFKVPEGSVLEDLVKKLPGAEVDSDGTIKINGKTIQRILVNGKEFFSNDKDMAMKNIPTEIIENIKTYDRASDQERLTNIADGNEETVIDLTVKKGMNKGWFGNFDLGVGTEDQYANRINLNRFIDDNFQASIIGNLNSNGGGGMGMGRGGGGGGGGKNRNGQVGINAVASKDRKYEIGGNIRYNARKSENQSKSSSENIRYGYKTYSNRLSDSRSHNDNANAEFRIELQLDSLTTMLVRPVIGFGNSFSTSSGRNNEFNADPYSIIGIENEFEQDAMIPNSIRTNRNNSNSLSFSDNKQVSANMTISRRFKTRNRNLSFNGSFNINTSDGDNFNGSNATYFQVKTDSTFNPATNEWEYTYRTQPTYRYRLSPTNNKSFSAGFTYSEPVATNLILQTSYSYSYNYRKSMSDTYDLINKYKRDPNDPSGTGFESVWNNRDQVWDKVTYPSNWAALGDTILEKLGMLPDWYYEDQELYLSDDLTNHNKNIDSNHNINIQVRWNSNFITSSIGVQMVPQSQHIEQNYMGVDIDTTRHFFKISPSLQFRYRFNRQNQLNFSYRMQMNQPSITNLLNIVDDSNPLNIRMGNPELKNSFNHNFSLGWQNYVTSTMQSYNVNASFSMTSNNVSSRTQHDPTTGQSVTMPMNISGNWNSSVNFGFNTPLFANERLMLNTSTRASYNNNVSYLSKQVMGADGKPVVLDYVGGRAIYQYDDLKNQTNNLTLGENIRLNYRQDYWDIGISGNINYTHQKNKYQEVNSPNTFSFNYGVESNGNFNNGWGYSTNISMSSRRGYASKEANSNELVWNAQVSYRFLKGRAATISLQAYDILNNRKNFNRNISANGRTDTWTQTVNSYIMAHFIYRFNFFGSASGRRELRQQRAARQANMPMAPAGGGMPMGGGGMPMGGGMPGGGRF
ncbi:MAG: outer membrane beta-barrel protein [Bacteroidaceae bacterium]|nr:outer membrane beta-barrel protein [Bacteroidaceae bacterium]